MNRYSALPVLLLMVPLLAVLAAVGAVPWGAVAGVVLAPAVVALVRKAVVFALARKGGAPRPGGG
ncbi:hypothetical protein ACFWXK_37045 [Streptomyces sp. NPDC059070]|uniref:hypothetical protein n=1 Tax=unclassified Streptomyces TaxID=2593676 RepID=UPI0034E26988